MLPPRSWSVARVAAITVGFAIAIVTVTVLQAGLHPSVTSLAWVVVWIVALHSLRIQMPSHWPCYSAFCCLYFLGLA